MPQVKIHVCGVRASEMMAGGQARWPAGTVVSYFEALEFAGLTREMIAACYDKACAQWAAVCGLGFRRVADPAAANIVAGDGAIDGPYGILAQSELPYNADQKSQMNQIFDQAEPWAGESPDLLVACMCHEIGHAIGLEHLPGTGALMEPVIVPGRSMPQAADIAEVRLRYGPPSSPPAPPDFRALGVSLIPYVLGPFADGLVAAAAAMDAGTTGTDADQVRQSKEQTLRDGAWAYFVARALAPLDPKARAQAYRDLAVGVASGIS